MYEYNSRCTIYHPKPLSVSVEMGPPRTPSAETAALVVAKTTAAVSRPVRSFIFLRERQTHISVGVCVKSRIPRLGACSRARRPRGPANQTERTARSMLRETNVVYFICDTQMICVEN